MAPPPLPYTHLTAHRLLTSAVWSDAAVLCDCRTMPSAPCALSALSQCSWWKAGTRCVARGTAQLLKTPSMLLVWPRNSLPSNYPSAQGLKLEVGSHLREGVTLRGYCSQVHLLRSSLCMYNVLSFHHTVLSTHPHFLTLL